MVVQGKQAFSTSLLLTLAGKVGPGSLRQGSDEVSEVGPSALQGVAKEMRMGSSESSAKVPHEDRHTSKHGESRSGTSRNEEEQ